MYLCIHSLLYLYLNLYLYFSHRLVGDHLDASIRESDFVFVYPFFTLFVSVFVFVFFPPPRRRPLEYVHQGEPPCIHPSSNGLQCAPCDRGSPLQCKIQIVSLSRQNHNVLLYIHYNMHSHMMGNLICQSLSSACSGPNLDNAMRSHKPIL